MTEPEVDRRPVEFHYLGIRDQPPTLTDYHQGWELQRRIHAQVATRELGPQVLYVEHPPVYTAGRRTEPQERPVDGTPVVDVDRGGKITYHGPGQLVGYPIVFLPRGVGVVDYVRRVEEALIRLLAEYGIATGRVPGRTGVWLGDSLVLNMLRSWVELGAAPDVEAELDLVPVDYVSGAITKVVAGGVDRAIDVYHLNSPQPIPVQALASALADSGYRLRTLPYPAWRTEMLSRGDRRRQAMLDAVGPLLAPAAAEDAGWMARIPHCGNQLTQLSLGGLACPAVDAALLRRYVAYLQGVGSLPLPA